MTFDTGISAADRCGKEALKGLFFDGIFRRKEAFPVNGAGGRRKTGRVRIRSQGAHVPAARPPELCGASAPQACRQARSAPPPSLPGRFRFAGSMPRVFAGPVCRHKNEPLPSMGYVDARWTLERPLTSFPGQDILFISAKESWFPYEFSKPAILFGGGGGTEHYPGCRAASYIRTGFVPPCQQAGKGAGHQALSSDAPSFFNIGRQTAPAGQPGDRRDPQAAAGGTG